MFSDNSKPGFVLGRKFVLSKPDEELAFREFWQSLLWFSYRSDFPPIGEAAHTSDVGWGCTLRTAQMLLANAFMHHFMGHGTLIYFRAGTCPLCFAFWWLSLLTPTFLSLLTP